MKKSLITIFLLVLICTILQAQTDEVRAKAEFFMAEEAYNEKNYQKCLSHLQNTENYLGSTNPRILHLRIKASFETKQYAITKKAIDSFFAMETNTNSEQYKEILRIVAQMPDFFTDTRDGQSYKTVKIGNQTWMAENLNYNTGTSWCYDNNTSNCNKYGRLYDWNTARRACPSGWRLPSEQDFETLLSNVGGSGSKAYHALKDGGNSGFSALLGGGRDSNGSFGDVGCCGYWWSSSENDADNTYTLDMYSDVQVAGMNYRIKELGFSVRCLKD